MKLAFPLVLLPLLALAGCGGRTSSGCADVVGCGGTVRSVGVDPKTTVVAAGGMVVLRVYESGYTSPLLSFKVAEAGGGEIDGKPTAATSHEEAYFAPATPGTYHVNGIATEADGGKAEAAQITITVTAKD